MPFSPHVSRSWVGVIIDTKEIVLKQLRHQWCHLVFVAIIYIVLKT